MSGNVNMHCTVLVKDAAGFEYEGIARDINTTHDYIDVLLELTNADKFHRVGSRHDIVTDLYLVNGTYIVRFKLSTARGIPVNLNSVRYVRCECGATISRPATTPPEFVRHSDWCPMYRTT